MHPLWKWVVAEPPNAGNGLLGELTAARSRRLTVSLDDAAEASWSMSGRHREAALVDEMLTDLVVYRGADKLFRGRIGPSQDTITPRVHTDNFTAHDYRALVERRILYGSDILAFVGTDQSAIAWQLIANTQARPGGNAGITRGTGQTTGVTRDRTYGAGQSVGGAIADMGRVEQGFEWEIDADLAFNIFYPARGAENGVILDYGGTVRAATRSVNPASYANAGRVTGATGVATAGWEVDDLASRPEGRWDLSEGFPDISEAATLASKAAWSKRHRSALVPSWQVVLRPGRWAGPAELWLGDAATLVVRSGRLDVLSVVRVVQMEFAISERGSETVTVTLGLPTPSLGARLRKVSTRLADLERR